MNAAKILSVILSGWLFFVTTAHAEQKQAGNESGSTIRPKTDPKTSLTPAPHIPAPLSASGPIELKPLKDPLKIPIVLPLCLAIPLAVDMVLKEQAETAVAITAAGQGPPFKFHGMTGIVNFNIWVKTGCCSQQKNFSVQEQQAAGCAGGDTVMQCMEKLVKHCIREFHYKDISQEHEDMAKNISIKSTQLSERLKNLRAITP